MTSIRFRVLLMLLGTLIITAAGCARQQAAPDPEPEGLPVEVQNATTAEMRQEILLTGSIKTREDVTITASLPEEVTAVKVREGDQVKAGQTLITLDSRAVRSRLEQARAGLVAAQKRLALLQAGARTQERAVARNSMLAAKSNLDKATLDLARAQQLYEEGAAPKAQVDSARTYYEVAEAQYESAKEQYDLAQAGARTEEIEAAQAAEKQAQAMLELAQNDVDNSTLHSPISGVVYYRAVNIGDVPMTGVPLLKIADLENIYFLASVPEKDFASLAVDQPVTVTADALPQESFSGVIERLVPVAQDDSREFMARIAVQNDDLRLRPGMFARANVLIELHPQAVVIPAEALIERNGDKIVFVVREGKAEVRTVTLGIDNAHVVEVLEGVSPGENVVTVGQTGLKSGQQVQIKRSETEGN